ncbi:MAG TPA: lysine--tRNA ligase [Myxococcales bacterium]|nr:lysine--tRNA ligase [Myxococcales bacterium]HIN85053.1 lysine--tRNA ligase [Myxococcales bacterium]HIO21563.1 lysine--tRNA ligase [Nitrospirales bacterium]
MDDYNEIMRTRAAKAEQLRSLGHNPFANNFNVTHTLAQVRNDVTQELPSMGDIADDATYYRLAGRVMAVNDMGKAAFVRIRDRSCTPEEPNLQLYVRKDRIGEEAFNLFKSSIDVGDFVGAMGPVFQTRRGELSVMVTELQILTKSIRPLPEKWHGLTDKETRFRQRYADLIMSMEVREVFKTRARLVSFVRNFLEQRDFMEVETPMMQPLAGGATARPFETYHNALNIPLFLRVAPELYLKRLVVGGFERVYELNRNFRNEGMSPKHNPEFTMLEFYMAHATYEDLIELTQEMLCELCQHLHGTDSVTYGEHTISLKAPFARYTVRESLREIGKLDDTDTDTLEALHAAAEARSINFDPAQSYGKMLMHMFDELVESKLIQPTFITQFPLEVSPLSRRNDSAPEWVDRYELFVAGNELANAFSELNDPVDQQARFEDQMVQREAGDDEAHPIDRDYIRALEYGMPPTAGQGIGIDRLVMLMTGQQSIREVIFFPHMRPEQS